MRQLAAFLILCSACLAEVPWPISTAFTWEIPLWDGTAKVTGATVTCSIGKDTDADGIDDSYWTGSAWGSYTALSMTEESGNAHLSGKYKYTLSSSAVGSTSNVFIHFSSTYTSGITIWNTETLRTTLPSVISGAVASLAPNAITYLSFDDGAITDDAWAVTASGLSSDEHTWLQYVYGRLGAVAVTVVQFVQTNGTISITQNTDYPSGTISLSRTWPYEDLTGAACTFSAELSVNGAIAINASSCTFTGGTTGSTLVVDIPLTRTQTAALGVKQYTYEVRFVLSGGTIYRPFTGVMNVARYVN